MSDSPRLPVPHDLQEIRAIFQRHGERTSNITPIISISEALIDHFSVFSSREIDDIHRQLEILEPWYQISEEKRELVNLESQFETLRGNLSDLIDNAKRGRIKELENIDLDIIIKVFQLIDDVEKLWYKVQRLSMALLRQGELFRQWLEEMLPHER
ncbi:MAG: hypothetical protein ACFFCW_47390 [Candidatus Hodarchaeota archaeon]